MKYQVMLKEGSTWPGESAKDTVGSVGPAHASRDDAERWMQDNHIRSTSNREYFQEYWVEEVQAESEPMSHSPEVLAVIECVATVCARVTKTAPLNPKDLIAELGTLDRETKSAVYIQPSNARFRQVILGQESDGRLGYVELALAAATGGIAAALKANYGDPMFPPAVGTGPIRAQWVVDVAPDRPASCTVRATFEVVPGDDLSGAVTSVDVQVVPR